jgi:hypothetical protein
MMGGRKLEEVLGGQHSFSLGISSSPSHRSFGNEKITNLSEAAVVEDDQ